MERKSVLVIDNVSSRRDNKRNKAQNYSDFSTIKSISPRQKMDQDVIEKIKERNIDVVFFSRSQKLLAKERRCEKI
jgi:hypothetical protein